MLDLRAAIRQRGREMERLNFRDRLDGCSEDVEPVIFRALNLDDTFLECLFASSEEGSFQDLTNTEKLGLSLLELTELLVRRPVTLLAGRAAVESRRTVAEVFGDFLSGTAAAVSGSWFGADCASHGWRGGGNHGCSGVDVDEVALCDGCSARFALGGWRVGVFRGVILPN
jgi:hypothetical protein